MIIELQEGVSGYSGSSINEIIAPKDNVYLNLPDYAKLWSGGTKGGTELILKFENPFNSLPADSQIISAKLKLFQISNSKAKGHVIQAYPIKQNFNKSQVTWNHYNKPAGYPWQGPGAFGEQDLGGLLAEITLDEKANVWREWDITRAVQDWKNGAMANNGIILRGRDYVSGTYSDYAWIGYEDVTKRPILEVVYTTLPLPNAPIVTSSAHLEKDQWVTVLTWSNPQDTEITGYSYILDQVATTLPDDTSEGLVTEASYTDKEDGTWYFHVKAQNSAGWGETAHFMLLGQPGKPTWVSGE
jgi:hypothetical protein